MDRSISFSLFRDVCCVMGLGFALVLPVDAQSLPGSGIPMPTAPARTRTKPNDKPSPKTPSESIPKTEDAAFTVFSTPSFNHRVIKADVVALDQSIIYNRYGAFTPNSMIFALKRDVVDVNGGPTLIPGQVRLRDGKRPRPLVLRANENDILEITLTNLLDPILPGTRTVGIQVNGLETFGQFAEDGGANVGLNAQNALAPGSVQTFQLLCPKAGTYFMFSAAGAAGGELSQVNQGLFGAVNVEPKGSTWYRSQVTDAILAQATIGTNPDGTPIIDYKSTGADGLPLLRLIDQNDNLIYSDLNAIIENPQEDCTNAPPSGSCGETFREFTVIFHDEMGITQAFPILNQRMMRGGRDAFGINYGTGGIGAEVMANRLHIGPAANAGEAKFEEFFLESWALGDPAMVVEKDPVTGIAIGALYPDDPSNVHHSYLGDPVRMRNLHAGNETHVFHLHAHQWLFSPKDAQSTYLDSQAISPGSTFTYEIQYGGTGNRNYTPGDSIFHCHLYPHFAMGMWELWRSHDVFEAGTPDRMLPDGEILGGTPNPGLVPLPRRPMPPMPTAEFKGYPFYIPGVAGHRAPQPALDIEWDGGLPRHVIVNSQYLEGPAAIADYDLDPSNDYMGDPVAQRVLAANLNPNLTFLAKKLTAVDMQILPQNGTPAELVAMSFHDGTLIPGGVPITDQYGWPAIGYPAYDSFGHPGRFLVNGLPGAPGAPFADPCPPTFVDGQGQTRPTPPRIYRAAYVQFDMTVNALGWHDRQARIIVLNDDVTSTLDGTRAPEPFFFRANSGDCITFHPTNLIPSNVNVDDFQIFTPTDTIGQHIHLVKFDVTSADGSGNGWNYEDGTFAPNEVRERIEANNVFQQANGGTQILTAMPHPVFGTGVNGAYVGAQTTTQRWWADPLVDTNGADRTMRTVFTHDHFGPSTHQQHGFYAALVVEPTDSTWQTVDGLTTLGTRADGGPTSFAANIISGPSGADSYREYMLEWSDLVPLHDLNNMPVNPPSGGTEIISTRGAGAVINYRNEPANARLGGSFSTPNGDPAFAFSTPQHGDPFTQILGVYPGDNVQIRPIEGGQAFMHNMGLTGHRWLWEPSMGNSGYQNVQPMGISEHFEWEITATDGFRPTFGAPGTADYMYESTPAAEHDQGIWGLMRAYSTMQAGLAALPNNPNPSTRPTHPLASGTCPTGPGMPPVRHFDVEAWRAADLLGPNGIVYNIPWNFHDPDGIVFVEATSRPELIAGTRPLEPLMMRVNAGDCVEVSLVNNLPLSVATADIMSARVGLQPTLVSYDVGASDGASIGNNVDTTVGPGQTRSYAWYAGEVASDAAGQITWTPREYGVTAIRAMGDYMRHAQRGAAGVLIVEPQNAASYIDYTTGLPATGQYEADILDASGTLLFREFVMIFQDGVYMWDNLGRQVQAHTRKPDMFAMNGKTEPIWSRLGLSWVNAQNFLSLLDQSDACSTIAHGDPETPVCVCTTGMPVRLRFAHVGAGWTGEPLRSIAVGGHNWQRQPWINGSSEIGNNPTSENVGAIFGFGPMSVRNVNIPSAGGETRTQGDFLIRSMDADGYTNGEWCILRVQ